MYAINKLFKFVRNKKYFSRIYTHSQCKVKPPWKVIFYGTDEFSVESLKVLCKEYRHGSLLSNLEVVTSPKAKKNPIEVYSQQEKLLVHKYPVDEIKCGNFDIGIVVSFGHLIPANIIKSFNL
uniref:Formyl transferase N-terminal domain-containing protein n=2 Tax=Photinus pyralis TaxID=7054 RepID=A0A1Y1KCF6_PHOPY